MFNKLILTLFLVALAPLSAAAAAEKAAAAPADAKKKPPPKPKSAEGGKVGYGTAVIQMLPLMVPYRTSAGVRYQMLTPRISLAPGETERPACFMIPIIHEKMLLYLYAAQLQPADFEGQRKEVLEQKLLSIAIAASDKSLFTGVKLVDANAPPLEIGSDAVVSDGNEKMEQRSLTLSAQCK